MTPDEIADAAYERFMRLVQATRPTTILKDDFLECVRWAMTMHCKNTDAPAGWNRLGLGKVAADIMNSGLEAKPKDRSPHLTDEVGVSIEDEVYAELVRATEAKQKDQMNTDYMTDKDSIPMTVKHVEGYVFRGADLDGRWVVERNAIGRPKNAKTT